MILDKLPYDKAKHAIGGGIVAAAAAALCIKAGWPQWAYAAAMASAAAAGIAVEVKQWIGNRTAVAKREVSGADALATALGGAPVALPLLVSWLVARGAL